MLADQFNQLYDLVITVTLWIWNALVRQGCFANPAYDFDSNECNIVIIAACIPTLRPLFLVIFRRPGRDRYLRRNSDQPRSGIRNQHGRIGRMAAPTSESTTAIGHADNEGSWLELGPSLHGSHDGDIRQTIEVDVTSHKRTSRLGEEDMCSFVKRNAV